MRSLIALLCLVALSLVTLTVPVLADSLRVATWNVGLDRSGPGILLRDILRGEDAQIDAISRVIARAEPDIVVLQKFDYDHDLHALRTLRDRLAEDGPHYDHIFARRPNSGMPTGLDMDDDGRRGNERDAQGYGAFSGQGGMAILSAFPIDADAVQDFSALLWRDLPGALLPTYADGTPFPSKGAQDIQRLSYTAHWVVPVNLPSGLLHLLAFHATPPVFDGPEDANGRRNHDEIRFWQLYLDGAFGPVSDARFIVIGDANLDPDRSDGRRSAAWSTTRAFRIPARRIRAPRAPVRATPPSTGSGPAPCASATSCPRSIWRLPAPASTGRRKIRPRAIWPRLPAVTASSGSISRSTEDATAAGFLDPAAAALYAT